MKGLVAAIAAVVALTGSVGVAYGQYDYGSMVPGYGQDYGQGYGQYGQSMPDYSQYAQGQGNYGQQSSPYQQGQEGYSNYPGYGGYQGYGYGSPQDYNYYQGYGAGRGAPNAAYQQQQTPSRRGARQPAQYQAARPQQQQRPVVTERPLPQSSTRASVQPSSRESSSIYWDGRETGTDTSQGAGMQAPAQIVQPQPQPAMRQQVRSTSGAVQSPRRTTRSAVKRESASVVPSPPPPRRNVQWGKQDNQTSDLASQEEKPETKRVGSSIAEGPARSQNSMRWGKQERPSIVGSEPGSSEGTGVITSKEAGSQGPVETESSAKKFEWGKTIR